MIAQTSQSAHKLMVLDTGSHFMKTDKTEIENEKPPSEINQQLTSKGMKYK